MEIQGSGCAGSWRAAAQGWMDQAEREVALREAIAAENDRYREALVAAECEITGDSDWTIDRWAEASNEAARIIREALDG